jgi:rhamnogalacturonan endolyase
MNFRIYWDGDAQDELLDGINITKYNVSAEAAALKLVPGRSGNGSPASCNSTKSTPNLSADIFGDWREEVILWNSTNSSTLNIYTSTTTTDYRVPTLMHDHVYRMGVAWQNVAYNQPPHLGYYLPDYIESFQGINPTGIHDIHSEDTRDTQYYNLMGTPVDNPSHGVYIVKGKKILVK